LVLALADRWHPGSGDPRDRLYRALITRAPGNLSEDDLVEADRVLAWESRQRAIVVPGTPNARVGETDLVLVKGDLTRLGIDAVVNAANDALLGCFVPHHACIDNAFHAAAGPRLRDDCGRIAELCVRPEPTGSAKATRAYHLPSRFVLHTVGPIVRGRVPRDSDRLLLEGCYQACLELATALHGVRSLGFCSISTGVFGYPIEAAAPIAVAAVEGWLRAHPGVFDRIVFDLWSDQDLGIYKEVLR